MTSWLDSYTTSELEDRLKSSVCGDCKLWRSKLCRKEMRDHHAQHMNNYVCYEFKNKWNCDEILEELTMRKLADNLN